MTYNLHIIFLIAILCILCLLFMILYVNFTGVLINLNKCTKVNPSLFKQYQCFTSDECVLVSKKIKELRKNWIRRTPFDILYTLGKASYMLDNTEDCLKSNILLHNNFDWMYIKIAKNLEQILKEPVKYIDKKRGFLPGFHIFPKSYLSRYPIASFHIDGQYNEVNWENKKLCDFMNPLTFTVCFEKPKSGAGIYMFEAKDTDNRLKAMFSNKERIEYKLGYINIHTGRNWHLISPGIINNDEYRITIQGHLIKCDGNWIIYW